VTVYSGERKNSNNFLLLFSTLLIEGPRRIAIFMDKNRSFFKKFLSTASREISLIKINALSHNSSNSPPLVLES